MAEVVKGKVGCGEGAGANLIVAILVVVTAGQVIVIIGRKIGQR